MKQEKGKVLVLGSFHMSEYEGLNSDKRQAEIEEFVAKLANFNPTKIAVENEVDQHEILNKRYKQYKQGTYKLNMNEITQVGFRLGFRLGHEQIYPIDWMGKAEMSYGEMEEWAKENQPELLSKIYKDLFHPELTTDKTILDFYKELNDPAWLHIMHKMYVNIAHIGDFDNYIGMEWLSWWYKRNLIMFANLTRLIESGDDRILFIVGASHSTIVNKFLEESELCDVV